MSSKSQLDDFLDILKQQTTPLADVKVNGKDISILPLSFQQQKALVTTGLDGLVGVISFIYQLNSAIHASTGDTTLKVTDRVPIILHLRNLLSDKPIEVEDVKVDVKDLIANISDYTAYYDWRIQTDQYTVILEIPTLARENKFLLECIKELKPLQESGLGDNISVMLSYEIPKFIKAIEFGENVIDFDKINLKEQIKIANNLPASITSQISDFIKNVSDYDEKLLTIDGVTVELDSSLFE